MFRDCTQVFEKWKLESALTFPPPLSANLSSETGFWLSGKVENLLEKEKSSQERRMIMPKYHEDLVLTKVWQLQTSPINVSGEGPN